MTISNKMYEVTEKSYTPEQWHTLATDIFGLIMTDIDALSPEDIPQTYPKLVIMYEFFRLVRGEAFTLSRPSGLGELQRDLYAKQDEIADALRAIGKKLDPSDESTLYYLERMKKSFEL